MHDDTESWEEKDIFRFFDVTAHYELYEREFWIRQKA